MDFKYGNIYWLNPANPQTKPAPVAALVLSDDQTINSNKHIPYIWFTFIYGNITKSAASHIKTLIYDRKSIGEDIVEINRPIREKKDAEKNKIQVVPIFIELNYNLKLIPFGSSVSNLLGSHISIINLQRETKSHLENNYKATYSGCIYSNLLSQILNDILIYIFPINSGHVPPGASQVSYVKGTA